MGYKSYTRKMFNMHPSWEPYFEAGKDVYGFDSDSSFIRYCVAQTLLNSVAGFSSLGEAVLKKQLRVR